MEELYRTIEETIKTSGCPFPADGEEIYNEICDEIDSVFPKIAAICEKDSSPNTRS